ncbi:tyrosinase [Ceratobasidium sp. AG-Ba]|nr:tyrosinase [Ceratobasidium sp. AG-Ba]
MFPNWHRPYIMLIEQSVCDVAYGIAGEYAGTNGVSPERAKLWMKAAKELRFPFWDWTDPSTRDKGLPKIFQQEKVNILTPDGRQQQHQNPLAYYKFTQSVDGFNNRMEVPEWQNQTSLDGPPQLMAYFREWNRTYRRPNSRPVGVTEDYKALDADLMNMEIPFQKGSWAQLTNDVANMFSFPTDLPPEQRANAWDQFSNTTFQSGRRDINDPTKFHSPFNWHATSLEQPHNRVHLIVGGLGHMGDNDTAGFDPIFFLHHCNVDRLLSFWEYVYPDYVAGTQGYLDVDGETRVPFVQGGGTYIETSEQQVDGETPLMPFRKLDYTYWNSRDTHSLNWFDPNGDDPRYVQNKNYTYEPIGFVDINKPAPTLQEREWNRGYLQRHFGSNPAIIKLENLPIFRSVPVPSLGRSALSSGAGPQFSSSQVEKYRHFIVEASLSPKYHSGSYTLNVTVQLENNQEIVIGSISVLARGNSAKCGNCLARRATDSRVRGVVNVPPELVSKLTEDQPIDEPIAHQSIDHDSVPAFGSAGAKKLVKNMLITLGSHVMLPSGAQHGRLNKTIELGAGERDPAAPVVRLLSSDVHQLDLNDGQDNAPFNLVNWQDHGSPYGEWTRLV